MTSRSLHKPTLPTAPISTAIFSLSFTSRSHPSSPSSPFPTGTCSSRSTARNCSTPPTCTDQSSSPVSLTSRPVSQPPFFFLPICSHGSTSDPSMQLNPHPHLLIRPHSIASLNPLEPSPTAGRAALTPSSDPSLSPSLIEQPSVDPSFPHTKPHHSLFSRHLQTKPSTRSDSISHKPSSSHDFNSQTQLLPLTCPTPLHQTDPAPTIPQC